MALANIKINNYVASKFVSKSTLFQSTLTTNFSNTIQKISSIAKRYHLSILDIFKIQSKFINPKLWSSFFCSKPLNSFNYSKRVYSSGKNYDDSDYEIENVENCNVHGRKFLETSKFSRPKPKTTFYDSNNTKYCSKSYSSGGDSCKSSPPGRDKYHADTETAINQQICAELNAAFAYLSMSTYFGRTSIALPGCQNFFLNMHKEEMEHAQYFINYQLMRGGEVKWYPINIPDGNEWDGGICKAFSVSLEMEKLVKEKLEKLTNVAEKHKDFEVMDVVSNFMKEQNKSIWEMGRFLVRTSKMTEDPVGEFLFDTELFKQNNKNDPYK